MNNHQKLNGSGAAAERAVVGQWWAVEIRSGQSVDPVLSDFIDLFIGKGCPAGAAVFCGSLDQRREALFFTPKAAAIADSVLLKYSARPCQAPCEGFFLTGNEQDRELVKQAMRQ